MKFEPHTLIQNAFMLFCAAVAAADVDDDDVNEFQYINFNAFSINASAQKAFRKLVWIWTNIHAQLVKLLEKIETEPKRNEWNECWQTK